MSGNRSARVSLVVGSRRSALATRQARWVADRLRAADPELRIELTTFVTQGDRRGDRPLPEIGGKGLFTADLEAALLAADIDLAVHSLKDLPTAAESPAAGSKLAVLGIPSREDPRDILVLREAGGGFEALAPGDRVGTSSTRRAGQILALRPDLRIVSVRGNVETRLAKLEEGAADALLLAAAGLRRLGIEREGVVPLEPPGWLPAPGQGALAVQGRADDAHVAALVARIEDAATRAATTAERALLATLEGGCHAPVAALGLVRGEELELRAAAYDPTGRRAPVRGEATGPVAAAAALGRSLALRLLEEGAARLVTAARGERGPTPEEGSE